MGEGRFPQEGAETSCRPKVGMPRADTFTRIQLNRETTEEQVVVYLGVSQGTIGEK
jgi:hypothetical protein